MLAPTARLMYEALENVKEVLAALVYGYEQTIRPLPEPQIFQVA